MKASRIDQQRSTSARGQRHRHFVGRRRELALFRRLLRGSLRGGQVLFVHGAGGIGKTALLAELASLCRRARLDVTYLDGRHVAAMPGAFRSALAEARGRRRRREEPLFTSARRQALFVDTCERLRPLDEWLRETIAPPPRGALAILAGREPPSPAWRTALRFGEDFHVIGLRGLSVAESSALLRRHRVPRAYHRAAQSFTHGHPLALTLVAEIGAQRPAGGTSSCPPAWRNRRLPPRLHSRPTSRCSSRRASSRAHCSGRPS